jgi:hypothetical protein
MQQTWVAMLQMIPHLSKEKAIALTSNSEFSCPKRVFEAMNDSSQPKSKRMLLCQSSFGKMKNGLVRKEAKLSKQIYIMMTATEGNIPLTVADEDDSGSI